MVSPVIASLSVTLKSSMSLVMMLTVSMSPSLTASYLVPTASTLLECETCGDGYLGVEVVVVDLVQVF